MKKYIKNGQVGVLVSYGYGAGWSTWNTIEYALDKRIIEKFLEEVSFEEMKTYMESIGYDGYLGGFKGLELIMIEEGQLFKINEYDGAESLEVGTSNFMQA